MRGVVRGLPEYLNRLKRMPPVTGIGRGPARFLGIHVAEKAEPSAYRANPPDHVDRFGEVADLLSGERRFLARIEHICRSDGLVAEPIIDNVEKALQYPDPAHEGLIECSPSAPGEVVEIAGKTGSAIPGQVLGDLLLECHYGVLGRSKS